MPPRKFNLSRSEFGQEAGKMTRFSDLKGMTVVDWEGTIIGKLKDFELSLINNSIVAIVVHQGFFRHDTKILMEYVDKIENNMIFLKICPITKLVGRKVFDSCAKEVGKVTEVVKVGETNVLKDLIVKMTITVTRDAGAYDRARPLPGEKMPVGEFRVSAENPLTFPSSDIDSTMPESKVEEFKEEVTVSAKFIDSIGDHITLKLSKEELINELF